MVISGTKKYYMYFVHAWSIISETLVFELSEVIANKSNMQMVLAFFQQWNKINNKQDASM